MKEIWRNIKGYNGRFKISNYGRIKSKIKDKERFLKTYNNGTNGGVFLCFMLYKNGKRKSFSLARTVLKYFKKKEIKKDYALHLNLNNHDNKSNNLKWSTLGDIRRYINSIKKKKRGISYFPKGHKHYRAIIKVKNKVITCGYFKTKKEAERCYIKKFIDIYGYHPYIPKLKITMKNYKIITEVV
jgi:hypothetical protein